MFGGIDPFWRFETDYLCYRIQTNIPTARQTLKNTVVYCVLQLFSVFRGMSW